MALDTPTMQNNEGLDYNINTSKLDETTSLIHKNGEEKLEKTTTQVRLGVNRSFFFFVAGFSSSLRTECMSVYTLCRLSKLSIRYTSLSRAALATAFALTICHMSLNGLPCTHLTLA